MRMGSKSARLGGTSRPEKDAPAVRSGSPTPSSPMSLGIEGPKISRSRRPIRGRCGSAARARARFTASAKSGGCRSFSTPDGSAATPVARPHPRCTKSHIRCTYPTHCSFRRLPCRSRRRRPSCTRGPHASAGGRAASEAWSVEHRIVGDPGRCACGEHERIGAMWGRGGGATCERIVVAGALDRRREGAPGGRWRLAPAGEAVRVHRVLEVDWSRGEELEAEARGKWFVISRARRAPLWFLPARLPSTVRHTAASTQPRTRPPLDPLQTALDLDRRDGTDPVHLDRGRQGRLALRPRRHRRRLWRSWSGQEGSSVRRQGRHRRRDLAPRRHLRQRRMRCV